MWLFFKLIHVSIRVPGSCFLNYLMVQVYSERACDQLNHFCVVYRNADGWLHSIEWTSSIARFYQHCGHANHYSFCLIITHFSPWNCHFCLIVEIEQKIGKFFTISSCIKHFLGCVLKSFSILKIECWHLWHCYRCWGLLPSSIHLKLTKLLNDDKVLLTGNKTFIQ